MKVLIPLDTQTRVYHDNVFKAPNFGVYSIDKSGNNLFCSFIEQIPNPFSSLYHHETSCQDHGICDTSKCTLKHLHEHYTLLQGITSCDFILANRFCTTMTKAFNEKGIHIYKIPPFVHKPDVTIKNFLLGVSLASTLRNIHFGS